MKKNKQSEGINNDKSLIFHTEWSKDEVLYREHLSRTRMRLGKGPTHSWEEDGSRQRGRIRTKVLSGQLAVFRVE